MNESQLKSIFLILIFISIIMLAGFTIKLKMNWNELEEKSSNCEYFNENTVLCDRCYQYNTFMSEWDSWT